MSQRTTTVSRERQSRPDPEPNTLMNALIGAVVTVVTAPALPFAAIVGGAVAGYLQQRDGLKVGALSGAIAAVPAFFIAWLIAGVLLIGADPVAALTSVFAIAVFAAVLAYLVLAGALGGLIGVYVREEL